MTKRRFAVAPGWGMMARIMEAGPGMTVTQLIYYSQPFGFDEAMLNGILLQARRNNARDGLTGALIVRRDLYLQMLEGPEAAVVATFARIKRDDRHLAVNSLACETVGSRLFPDWTMRDDPAQSWLWNEQAVSEGALDRAGIAALRDVFARVAASEVV
jgi:hypothetical protein